MVSSVLSLLDLKPEISDSRFEIPYIEFDESSYPEVAQLSAR